MPKGNKKFVNFFEYCKRCENEKKSASDDPCNACLGVAARDNSEKPEYFKEKEK